MPTHFVGNSEETRALNTYIKLTRAADSFQSRLSRHKTQGGLSPTQFGVLEALYHLGTMSQGEISAKVLKSSGNITLVIDNLEKQGLVRRMRDEHDRRMVQVVLTQQGQELIEKLLPGHVQAIAEEMRALEPHEQEELGRLCRKLGTYQSS